MSYIVLNTKRQPNVRGPRQGDRPLFITSGGKIGVWPIPLHGQGLSIRIPSWLARGLVWWRLATRWP